MKSYSILALAFIMMSSCKSATDQESSDIESTQFSQNFNFINSNDITESSQPVLRFSVTSLKEGGYKAQMSSRNYDDMANAIIPMKCTNETDHAMLPNEFNAMNSMSTKWLRCTSIAGRYTYIVYVYKSQRVLDLYHVLVYKMQGKQEVFFTRLVRDKENPSNIMTK